LYYLGWTAHALGQFEKAHNLYEQSLTLWQQINQQWGIAETLSNLGMLAYFEGDYSLSRMFLLRGLAIQRELNAEYGICFCLWNLGGVACALGDYSESSYLYKEALELAGKRSDKGLIAFLLEGFGCLAGLTNRIERATRLFGAAEAIREAIGYPLPPWWGKYCRSITNALRDALGEAAFFTALKRGHSFNIDQAITYALSE
jgi:tetratricopeptide (TPR) repeat protein